MDKTPYTIERLGAMDAPINAPYGINVTIGETEFNIRVEGDMLRIRKNHGAETLLSVVCDTGNQIYVK